MDRRRFLLTSLAGALAAPHATSAQPSGKVPTIGFLSRGTRTPGSRAEEAFRQGFRDVGYDEGKTLVVHYRFAEGSPRTA
jgi:putative ABC transport system substrate-binding protein